MSRLLGSYPRTSPLEGLRQPERPVHAASALCTIFGDKPATAHIDMERFPSPAQPKRNIRWLQRERS